VKSLLNRINQIHIMTKKLLNNLPKAIIPVFVFYFLYGCYPKGPEYYSDLDLTVTDYDADYNFGAQKSYWMADTVEYITNIEDDEIDKDLVEALLSKVASNLEGRGYQRLSDDDIDNADFAITVSVIASKNSGVGWVPGPPIYPGWGWGPGWGGYYPPYWGGYYSYSYTTGSVIINWWDPQEAPAPTSIADEDQQPIHWLATFNGLVSSSEDNNATRVGASIDQAFAQSTYIQSK
jgi:hypothetical protein